MGRGDLTDDQWRRLRPLLPAQKPRTGRPGRDHHTVINGILWILRTGAPWRDLPERFRSWATVASRFYRWRKQGWWYRLLPEVQREADAIGQVGWEVHYVDGTRVRAGSARCWCKKGEGDQALGRSRGGFGTKIHLRVGGQGKPVAFVLTTGQRHEASVFEELMTQGEVIRSWSGRPRAPAGMWRQRVQQPQGSGLSQTVGNSLHHPAEN